MLKTSKNNPRNGEGSFIRLKDGRIMYAYTQYYGDDWTDHAIARIAACYSADEGETWSESEILFEKPEYAQNIMSVSLFRLPDGDIGMIYLQKEIVDENRLGIRNIFRRSSDEGKTFTEGVAISKLDRRGTNNDRVVVLKSGRIVCPAQHHPNSTLSDIAPGHADIYYSDDNGATWLKSKNEVHSPYNDYTKLQEPGVFELPDGRLWMYARTGYGCQFQAFSYDSGETWSEATPNWRFTSPDSPMLVKNVGKYTLAIFNPVPFSPVNTRTEVWGSPKRTPFICAVSTDGGLSFVDMSFHSRNGDYQSFVDNCYYLEDDLENSYCYPAVIQVENGFLVAYYHSDNTDVCLNVTKITKVNFDELD